MTDAWNGSDLLELLVDHILQLGDILVKQDCQVCLLSGVLSGLNPAGDIGVPSQVSWVDVEDASSGHCGRSGSLQVGDLKQKLHVWSECNSLIAGQGQDLVVIHDSVETLNPHWINVPIQDNPLWAISRQVGSVSHDVGEQSIFPLSGGRVDDSIELIICNSLWVEVCVDRLPLLVLVGLEQCFPHFSLTCPSFTHYEHRMPDPK